MLALVLGLRQTVTRRCSCRRPIRHFMARCSRVKASQRQPGYVRSRTSPLALSRARLLVQHCSRLHSGPHGVQRSLSSVRPFLVPHLHATPVFQCTCAPGTCPNPMELCSSSTQPCSRVTERCSMVVDQCSAGFDQRSRGTRPCSRIAERRSTAAAQRSTVVDRCSGGTEPCSRGTERRSMVAEHGLAGAERGSTKAERCSRRTERCFAPGDHGLRRVEPSFPLPEPGPEPAERGRASCPLEGR